MPTALVSKLTTNCIERLRKGSRAALSLQAHEAGTDIEVRNPGTTLHADSAAARPSPYGGLAMSASLLSHRGSGF